MQEIRTGIEVRRSDCLAKLHAAGGIEAAGSDHVRCENAIEHIKDESQNSQRLTFKEGAEEDEAQ